MTRYRGHARARIAINPTPSEESLARMPRYAAPGMPQHVIQRGTNRSVIFVAKADYRFFDECLRAALVEGERPRDADGHGHGDRDGEGEAEDDDGGARREGRPRRSAEIG